jgi:DNA polymerase-3 subunit delta
MPTRNFERFKTKILSLNLILLFCYMLYFFYGEDDFRLKQKINSVIATYKQKHQSGLNFGKFDLTREEEWEKLKNFLDSFSMFVEKKLAVVSGLFEAKKDIKEKFLEYLSDSDITKTQASFLAIGQKLERPTERKSKDYVLKDNKDLFKKLTSKNINAEEFNFLNGAKLENWIKKEVETRGGKISAQAIRQLAIFVGADLWRLNNEIDKLISYRAGKEILPADIDELVGAKVENDIFKTVDALAARNGALAFKLLHRHLAEGESEIYLLSMLVYQFRNLLLVKDQLERGVTFYELGKKIKLHPYVLRKSFEQSKNFSLPALKKIYERLAEIDIGIKGGRFEAQTALDLIIKEIAG